MKRVDFRDEIIKNKRSSVILMIGIFFVIVLLGYVISQAVGEGYFFIIMIFAIIFSLSYILLGYYNSDKIAIASVGAHLARGDKYRDYHNLVEGLALASGLPKPKLYVMNSSQINAFASGRNPANAVICVTTGALEKLERRELEGVLAHELSHVANYDIRYMTMVAVMVGMVSIISQIFLRSLWFNSSGSNDNKNGIFLLIGIILAILAPIVVYFVQLSISRKREYSADASSVKFTRYPDGLIGALNKIGNDKVNKENKIPKTVSYLFFANPLKGMSSTHPALKDRISKLKSM